MLEGTLVALITPFKGGEVDEESLRRLIEELIEGGVNGLVPCGTTGESATLSHEEHKRVVEITVKQVAKRVPVVAGAGSNNTREAIELTKHAKAVGADAALHITPYYNRPTQEGLFLHYQAIARETGFPLVPYNIASRTGVNIEPATMARIAELPEVVALKEASGNISQMAEIASLCGDKLTLLSGDDGVLLPLLAVGGKGVADSPPQEAMTNARKAADTGRIRYAADFQCHASGRRIICRCSPRRHSCRSPTCASPSPPDRNR